MTSRSLPKSDFWSRPDLTWAEFTWARLAMAYIHGYFVVNKTVRLNEGGYYEQWLCRQYLDVCYRRRIPFVALSCYPRTCEIKLDFDSADRGPEGELHPLPPAANAEIDALLKGKGRWHVCNTPVIKKTRPIEYAEAHELARQVFRVALRAARTPVAEGEWE